MREINYNKTIESLLTKDIMRLVSDIQKHKGQQNSFLEANTEIIEDMLKVARIKNIDASNKLAGIQTPPKKLESIVNELMKPRGYKENAAAGYFDVLNIIHDNYDDIPIDGNIILQLHRDLEKYSEDSIGGVYKNIDNSVKKTLEDGTEILQFQTVDIDQTEEALNLICENYNKLVGLSDLENLLLIPCFILDFLAIHPFNDANGRMSRLLTSLLLYRNDYTVGKYISIETIIERTEHNYFNALEVSAINWHTCDNDYRPFVEYFLSVLLNAYQEFESRFVHTTLDKNSRVEKLIQNALGSITKKDISTKYPDISRTGLNLQLKALAESNTIIVTKKGNVNHYFYNHDKDEQS